MMVTHILKDGTVLDDITGHVVKAKDAREAYALIDQINARGGKRYEEIQNQKE